MNLWALCFLIGVTGLQLLTCLPHRYLAIGLIVFSLLAWIMATTHIRRWLIYMIAIVLGFSWALWQAQTQLANRLPTHLEGKTLTVSGYIASLPKQSQYATEFQFVIKPPKKALKAKRLRLVWYGKPPLIQPGDSWRLQVRLKQPHANLNPGGFDYEQWLFQHKLDALGYVVPKGDNQLLSSDWWQAPLNRLRQYLAIYIQQQLSEQPTAGLITALTIGSQIAITPTQWQTMQRTGTSHLMAVSGLHIGLVAGLAFGIASWLWRHSGRLLCYLPAPQAAALFALLVAWAYSGIAGFALPTQRAVIMFAVFLTTILWRKHLPAWHAWSLALLVVLVFEPLSVLSASFWLSFGSVAIIVYGMSGRFNTRSLWWRIGRTQLVVGVGLIPLSLWYFHQISWVGFLANSIAIPWVGFLVLPIALWGSLCGLLHLTEFGGYLLKFAAQLLSWLWQLLDGMATWSGASWAYPVGGWQLLAAMVGIFLLLAPRGLPGRWLGFIWLLPALLWKPVVPAANELWLTVLDVGQGLAAVIQTQHHVLIYDTGPRYSAVLDSGKTVLLPFLQQAGITQLDGLVISHGDNDHSGGAQALLQSQPVGQIWTSVTERFAHLGAKLCEPGLAWQWDGVQFDFLFPTRAYLGQRNNSSCVLRIQLGQQTLLFPGDIERSAEHYLVTQLPAKLPTTVLIAPHHGSRSSSTPEFIAATQPDYVIFATGYRNRYHFPAAQVVTRYQQVGAKTYNTASSGALFFRIRADRVLPPEAYRATHSHYWNWQSVSTTHPNGCLVPVSRHP